MPKHLGETLALIVEGVGDGAAENAADTAEGLTDLHALAGDDVFVDLLVVPGTAHLQHGDRPVHGALQLDVAQQHDGIGDGGDVGLGDRLPAHQHRGGVGEHARDFTVLDDAGQRDDELAEGFDGRHPFQRRQAVDGDGGRLEGVDLALDLDQMILQADGSG